MKIMDRILGRHREEEIEKQADLALGKDRALGLEGEESYDLGLSPNRGVPPSFRSQFSEPESPFSPNKIQSPQYPQQPVMSPNKDLELISAKLDAIKAMLDNLNYRIQNLEKIAREGQ